MRNLIRYIALGVLALAAVPAASQPGSGHGPEPRRGAFQGLLEHRAELGLSAEQVQRLEAIGRQLEVANRPLRERLAAERERFLAERRAQLERMTPEQRQAEMRRMRRRGRPPLPPSMQPVAEEMRRNIHAAMREAHAVLTPEQRARVREMMREARTRRQGEGGARRHRRTP